MADLRYDGLPLTQEQGMDHIQNLVSDTGSQYELKLTLDANQKGIFAPRKNGSNNQSLKLVFDTEEGSLTLDRGNSGKVFATEFGTKRTTLVAKNAPIELDVFVDNSICEIFINGGKKTMTARFFLKKVKSQSRSNRNRTSNIAELSGKCRASESPSERTIFMRPKTDRCRQKAGVKTTVSRVINNYGYISEKTRQRVYRAMKELNYQPNSLARSLHGKSTHLIGIIFPSIMNPFYAELVQRVEEKLFAAGYKIILCNSAQNKEKERDYLKMLIFQNQVDGIIAGAHNLGIEEYKNVGLPIVSFGQLPV